MEQEESGILLVTAQSDTLVPCSSGELVPQLIFALLVHEDRYGVAMRVAVEPDGSAVCYAVEGRTWEGGALGHRWVSDVLVDLPQGINLREWTKLVVAYAAKAEKTGLSTLQFPAVPKSASETGPSADFYADVGSTFIRQRAKRRTATTPERLQSVAEFYRAALQVGTSTRSAVASALQVSESQAAKLIAQSRAAGHLGKAKPRQAGEIT